MRGSASEQARSAGLDLSQGYGVRVERVLEEESGDVLKVLLLTRADGGVASAFSCSETHPTSEAVSARAWEDYRAAEGHMR